ncbi:efflux transporter outer membrane subunit [Olivibacter sp. CPCC 100613]|uniref:efflux transporter outer membrane subunit n=1 Tax=Olivibacter sp. CPCC 100613 TaxID=3079931 RepID=UPI002FFB7E03
MKYKDKWPMVVVLLLVTSCKVSQKYEEPRMDTASRYRGQVELDSPTIASKNWSDFFTDTALRKLIAKGLEENFDVKMGLQRIIAAQAAFRQSRQAFLPEINASASVKRSRLAFPQGYGLINNATQYDAGLTMAWELDVWGKLNSSKKAALASLLATDAAQKAIRSKLVSDIAANYYTLLALDQRLNVLEMTLENRKNDVLTMRELKRSAVVNGAAVVQSEANQYAVEVAIPDVKQQIRETENVLCLLLGQTPGAIARTGLSEQVIPEALSTGVPAHLLRYRPDVAEAELTFRTAFEQVNVAKTAFYPSLNITAAGGFTSFDFSAWFTNAGLFAHVMGGLTQPIFNRGANKARLKTAEAQKQEAFYNFNKTLLTAGKEVSDALFLLEAASLKEHSRKKELNALEKAVDFTKELLRYSSATNYTDVLLSEQNLLNAQMNRIDDQLQQWQAVIALYRALGGGAQADAGLANYAE